MSEQDDGPLLESQAQARKPRATPLPPSQDQEQNLHPKSIPVPLCTAGRLSMPVKVFVRDYTMDDATRIALIDEDSLLETVFAILRSVTQDQIDVGNLHEEEAKQILLAIFLNFWSPSIDRYPYTPVEGEMEILEKKDPAKALKVRSGLENLWCLVPLTDGDRNPIVNARPIPAGFKEPFTITDKLGLKVSFRLPRMKDLLLAKRLVDVKYAQFEQDYYDVKEAMDRFRSLRDALGILTEQEVELPENTPEEAQEQVLKELMLQHEQEVNEARNKIVSVMMSIEPTRKRTYDETNKERALDLVRFKHAACLVSLDGEPLETQEAREEAYARVSVNVWQSFAKVLADYSFGIDSTLQVKSPITGGLVDQEIRFRLLDIVPTSVSGEAESLDVQFG